jgi:hypothetical protein
MDFIHDPDGITPEKLQFAMYLKNVKRGRIQEYARNTVVLIMKANARG